MRFRACGVRKQGVTVVDIKMHHVGPHIVPLHVLILQCFLREVLIGARPRMPNLAKIRPVFDFTSIELFEFAWPFEAMTALFTMMMQAFADAYFIGRVGDRELAALSFAFPILMIVTSVAIGLGAGTSSVVARAVGAHDHRRARRLSTDSLILSFIITALICAIGMATIGPLFRLMGAPEDMIPLISGYMTILYSGVPFVVVGMVGMSSMRATGETRLPGMLMVIASIANVILDRCHDHRRARRLSTDSLILSFIITALICAIGMATIGPLFRLMGAPEDMIPLISGYMTILYSGVPFVVVGMVGMSSMRATGETRLPGMLMVMASIANVILDPLLIFGIGPFPRMELNGAATAALTARGAMCIGALYLLYRRLDMLSFNRPDSGELKRSWVDILHVGIPAAGTNVIIPIATGVITAMIARYGPEAVAGFGVASRIESVMLVMFYAMSAIIGPFVGQNMSAGKTDRIFLALRLCTFFCLGFGLVIAVILALGSSWLPSLFSDNVDVTRVASMFLWIAPISFGAYGMVMVMNASFNGMGKPMPELRR